MIEPRSRHFLLGSSMRIGQFSALQIGRVMEEAVDFLAQFGLDNPRLDAEVLLQHVLALSKAGLYARLEEDISPHQLDLLRELLMRRAQREPVAYLVGRREFYGLDFYVDRRVMIPRPETELLTEEALRRLPMESRRIVTDIGTGSGAIAISLAVHRPCIRVYATDISAAALEVAAVNRRVHGVAERVLLLQGDLLDPLPEPVDLLVANLPYIPTSVIDTLDMEVQGHEPHLALDGGYDGLVLIRRLLETAPPKLRPGASILLEIGANQGYAVSQLAALHFPDAQIEVLPDLAGRDRVVSIVTPA